MAEILSDHGNVLGEFIAGPETGRRSVVTGVDQETLDLTVAMASGQEDAFGRFHERYFDRLFRYLVVVTGGDEQSALEGVQDTLVRVAKHVRRFETEEAFWSWLTVLARSAARDGARRRISYLKMLTGYARGLWQRQSVDKAPTRSEGELSRCVDAAMAALDPLEQRLVEGKYFSGTSVKQLAEAEALSVKAVESRLHRARQVIKKHMLLLLQDDKEASTE